MTALAVGASVVSRITEAPVAICVVGTLCAQLELARGGAAPVELAVPTAEAPSGAPMPPAGAGEDIVGDRARNGLCSEDSYCDAGDCGIGCGVILAAGWAAA